MVPEHKYPALLLNADYQPLSYFPLSKLPWKEAVKGVYEGNHVVVAEYDELLHSPSTTMRIPSVVALKNYCKPNTRVAFTRFNVFLRDGFRCQYCAHKFSSQDLTFDHVVPRKLGGQTAWDNIVSACDPCNGRKDHMTCEQAKMWPVRWPKQPTVGELMRAARSFPPNYLHETWVDFLYWDQELET